MTKFSSNLGSVAYVGVPLTVIAEGNVRAVMRGAQKAMHKVADISDMLAPKKTGALRQSSEVTRTPTSKGEASFFIDYTVDYAQHVHNWYVNGQVTNFYKNPTTPGTKPWFLTDAVEVAVKTGLISQIILEEIQKSNENMMRKKRRL